MEETVEHAVDEADKIQNDLMRLASKLGQEISVLYQKIQAMEVKKVETEFQLSVVRRDVTRIMNEKHALQNKARTTDAKAELYAHADAVCSECAKVRAYFLT